MLARPCRERPLSALHRRLQEYLAVRRATGFTMERHEKLLTQFTDYLAAHRTSTLTIEHALAWATLPSSADPRWWAARLSMVRGFAVHLSALDPAHQVPPSGPIPHGSRRTVPHLYTGQEINALIRVLAPPACAWGKRSGSTARTWTTSSAC